MLIARHIKLSNGIPRDIPRRLYAMTSEGKTGRLEDTIREKVKWTRFFDDDNYCRTDRLHISLEVICSSTARIAFYHK